MDSKWNWLSHKLILYAKKAFNIRYITLADGLLCAYYLCDHTQSLISVYILCKPTHCEYLSSVLWPWLMSLTLGSFHPEETACYPVIGSLFTELSTDWNPLRCVFSIIWFMDIHSSGPLIEVDLVGVSMGPPHSAWWPADGLSWPPLGLLGGTPYLVKKVKHCKLIKANNKSVPSLIFSNLCITVWQLEYSSFNARSLF